jgi:hypothetical protein
LPESSGCHQWAFELSLPSTAQAFTCACELERSPCFSCIFVFLAYWAMVNRCSELFFIACFSFAGIALCSFHVTSQLILKIANPLFLGTIHTPVLFMRKPVLRKESDLPKMIWPDLGILHRSIQHHTLYP